MSQCFPKPYKPFWGNVRVELDLPSYATKLDLKETTGIGNSNFALKSNLTSLKTEIDKIDIEKLKTVPKDLSKLSDVVDNDVIRKTVYDKLVTKVNNIDTTGFVLKTKYDTGKSDLDKKIVMQKKRFLILVGF